MIKVAEGKWINLDRVTIIEVAEWYNGREWKIRFYFDDDTVENIGPYKTKEEAITLVENLLKEK